jgi:glutaredoxin
MKKLELYFFPQCPYCQIVEEALRQTGLNKTVLHYDIMKNTLYKQELIKKTGRGTVPCLFIDGQPMHESKDIAAWLHAYAKELAEGKGQVRGN